MRRGAPIDDRRPGADAADDEAPNGQVAEATNGAQRPSSGHTEEMPRIRLTRRSLVASIVFIVSVVAFLYFVLPKLLGLRDTWNRLQHGNVWWLAIPSMGESWHNLHHSDPTAARHGVLRGQLDSSARIIWLMEKVGWVKAVRWPVKERLEVRRVQPNQG